MPRPILEIAALIIALALFAASQWVAPVDPADAYRILRGID